MENITNNLFSMEIRNRFVGEVCEELDSRAYDISFNPIQKIIDECNKQKSGLRSVLRNHPQWNEEKQMIWFDADISRPLELKSVTDFFNNIRSIYSKKSMETYRNRIKINKYCPRDAYYINMCVDLEREERAAESVVCIIDSLKCWFSDIKEQFINPTYQRAVDELNNINPEFKIRNNEKLTKAILRVCKIMGFDKVCGTYVKHDGSIGDNFNRWYSVMCDALNPIKVTRHTVISINPMDFLLMSYGWKWQSCHYIGEIYDSGCYSSGTISYMLDTDSFIVYTVDKEFDGEDIERTRKMTRQVFGYNDGVLAQLRLYPQSNDYGAEHSYKEMREIVQNVISICEKTDNLWNTTHSDVEDVVEGGYGYTCYPDWKKSNPGGQHCRISVFKGRDENKPKIITFGAEPICVTCGSRHGITESISCCGENYYCSECGSSIYEDEVCWINGDAYCSKCVVYCEHCDEYELRDNTTYIDGYGYVCEYCLEHNYTYCDECGTYEYNDDVTYIESEGIYVCDSCRRDYFTECEECGEWFRTDDLIEVDGELVCDSCLESEFTECEECGSIHKIRCMNKTIDGKLICDECLERIQDEEESEVA